MATQNPKLPNINSQLVDSNGMITPPWRQFFAQLQQGLNPGGPAGGTSGQVQYNNSGVLGGFTVGGDGSLNPASGALVITKTNGHAFATVATSGSATDLVNFLQELTSVITSLPIALPATPGQLWLNGGILAVS